MGSLGALWVEFACSPHVVFENHLRTQSRNCKQLQSLQSSSFCHWFTSVQRLLRIWLYPALGCKSVWEGNKKITSHTITHWTQKKHFREWFHQSWRLVLQWARCSYWTDSAVGITRAIGGPRHCWLGKHRPRCMLGVFLTDGTPTKLPSERKYMY